ncbi:MAG: hypothetical protein KF832_15820 [Caldilineaceae bacterium]|nr:hypothetical protein [Caldilineaceae bacterium]
MIVGALVVGGTLYAGVQAYQQLRTKVPAPWRKWSLPRLRAQPLPQATPASPALQKANQTLALSSASLGLTVTAIVLMQPLLSVATLPLVLYVFAPTYRMAYQALVRERRITNAVLDATRMTVCVVMGYALIGAINAWLQAFSQRIGVQADDELQQILTRLMGETETAIWLYRNGAEVEARLADVKSGDVVVIGPGDAVPATGVVIYGTAQVDQRLALGESLPVEKQSGDRVAAATIVQRGRLYVQLEQAPPPPLATMVRTLLEETPTHTTYAQAWGEQQANRMAPRMFAAFFLTLPLLGVNHAAAFLCTGFGAHMRTLGPLAVRRFIGQAAQAGLLIKDPRALEAANLVNTVIFNADLLADPTLRGQAKTLLHHLRQRPWLMEGITPHRFAAYVLVKNDEEAARQLVAEVGLDDYLLEPSSLGQATLVERLQTGGRRICYVGQGETDAPVMQKASVAIALRALATAQTTPAHVLLLDNNLLAIESFFRFATAFGAKQGVSLLAPIGLDILDLFTTLVLQFGLIYSVLFNYSGLLLGAFYANAPSLGEALPDPTPATDFAGPAFPAPTATTQPT